jgi:hypothetical protein
MILNDDPYNNLIMKPESSITEDVDYKILNDECFYYLYNIYGGVDLRRWSISVPSIEEETETPDTQASSKAASANDSERKEFIVELQLRRIRFYIVPRLNYYPTNQE